MVLAHKLEYTERIENLLDRISNNILYGTDLETTNKGVKTYIAGVDSFVDLHIIK